MKFFWDREEEGRLPGMSRRRFVFLGLGAGAAALVLPHVPGLIVPEPIVPESLRLYKTGRFFTMPGIPEFPVYGVDGQPTREVMTYIVTGYTPSGKLKVFGVEKKV